MALYIGHTRYKVMQGGRKADFELPFNKYTEVDYIQSTGTEYINTGYIPNVNTIVEFMASGISASSYSVTTGTWYLGGRQAYQQRMFGSYYNPSNQTLYFAFGTAMNNATFSGTNMYGDNKKIKLSKVGLYVNDTKVVNNTTTASFTSPVPLVLFALNNNGSIISNTRFKMHYCKIWDNNTLVRDYVPCVDFIGRPLLLDKLNGKAYYNEGTGQFLYG